MKLVCLVWLCWNKGLVRDIMRRRRQTTHIKMNRRICNCRNVSCQLPFSQFIYCGMYTCIAFILLKTTVFKIKFMISVLQYNVFETVLTNCLVFLLFSFSLKELLVFFYVRKMSEFMQMLCCELIFQTPFGLTVHTYFLFFHFLLSFLKRILEPNISLNALCTA